MNKKKPSKNKEKIKQLELEGQLNEEVGVIDRSKIIPLDNFNYTNKPIHKKVFHFLCRLFIVKPYSLYFNLVKNKVKVRGKDNLKKIKKAIIISNHVDMYDCLAINRALGKSGVQFAGADFNNKKGFIGEMMRASGFLPIGNSLSTMRSFNSAVKNQLSKDGYLVFYPEKTLWEHYRKPRPHLDGAYHYAIKHNVPIIPIFTTFENNGKMRLNILSPLHPDKNNNRVDEIEILKEAVMQHFIHTYETTYEESLNPLFINQNKKNLPQENTL